MKDLEIWKIQTIEFKSNGLLVSNYGNVKMSNFKDRKWGDNGNGYKLVNISELGTKRCTRTISLNPLPSLRRSAK